MVVVTEETRRMPTQLAGWQTDPAHQPDPLPNLVRAPLSTVGTESRVAKPSRSDAEGALYSGHAVLNTRARGWGGEPRNGRQEASATNEVAQLRPPPPQAPLRHPQQ